MDDLYYKQYEPIFGEWRIVEKLGEGSFGKVYEIERKDFGRTYKAALKVITVPPSESEIQNVISDGMSPESAAAYFRGFVEEVIDEFTLMSKLKGNSNIVSYENHKVYEHQGKIGWDILIQMELLLPLIKYAQINPLSENDVIKLGIDLCKALEVCHKYNVIHRDIKPDNIFVSQVGDYKLGDFGIARTIEKTTGGLSKKGTYNYMAPEVYKGEPYGYTVDIYSVGLVLYRFLNNNRLPFFPPYPQPIQYSDREQALVNRICGQSFDDPVNASKKLADIVMRACAYKPANRYQTAEEMRKDLEALLNKDASDYTVLDMTMKVSSILDKKEQPVAAQPVQPAPQAQATPAPQPAPQAQPAPQTSPVPRAGATQEPQSSKTAENKKSDSKAKIGKFVVALVLIIAAIIGAKVWQYNNVYNSEIVKIAKRQNGLTADSRVDKDWLSEIKVIDLTLSNITDDNIKNIYIFENLEKITLDGNKITKLDELAKLPNIKYVSAVNCKINLLPQNWDVEELYLGSNALSNIGPCVTYGNLKKIDLSNNAISDFTPLSYCSKLEAINISKQQEQANKINISGIGDLSELKSVTIMGTYVGEQIKTLTDKPITLDIGKTDDRGNPMVIYDKDHFRYEKDADNYLDINGTITDSSYYENDGKLVNWLKDNGKMVVEQVHPQGSQYWFVHTYNDKEKVEKEYICSEKQSLSKDFHSKNYVKYYDYIYNGSNFIRKERRVKDASCDWATSYVELGQYKMYPLVFKHPEETGRMEFKLKIYDIAGLNKTDNYNIYVKYVDSKWEKAGTYSLTAGETVDMVLDLDETRKFEKIMTMPANAPKGTTRWNNAINDIAMWHYSSNYDYDFDYE